MMLTDMRCFDLVEPSGLPKRTVLERLQAGQMTLDEAEFALHEGYFYYEWKDSHADEKASTEDVTFTRDISLAGMAKLGYNPLRCCWDSWIGHHKPYNVGKPARYTVDSIAANFRNVVLNDRRSNERIVHLNLGALFRNQPVHKVAPPEPLKWHEWHEMPAEHVDVLVELIKECPRRPTVLEVGTWMGHTAIAMANAGATVHCVDTWEGSPSDASSDWVKEAGGGDAAYEKFCENIGHRRDKSIFPWRRSSRAAARMYWTPFDIIFIDAEHTYEAVKADILAWWRHLADDGVMCGHDYETIQFPGVTKAVDELFPGGVEVLGKKGQGAIWLVKKADFPDFEARHAGAIKEQGRGNAAAHAPQTQTPAAACG